MNNVFEFKQFQPKKADKALIPDRLQIARKAKLMTQTDLAAEVELTRQAISSFEQGSKRPEGATLAKIASALEQPISYFLGASYEPFGQFSPKNYRAFGSSTKKKNEQSDSFSGWTASVAAYLSEKINFPDPHVPTVPSPRNGQFYEEEEIEMAAELVRSEWGLGVGPIGNLSKLIESKGVFICHIPMIHESINAFSFWSGPKPFIITSAENTTAVRRRFDLAHELGHLVLHQGVSESELEHGPTLKKIEGEANRFASAFLLPRISYPNEVFSTRLDSFVELKSRWKVAVSAQVYRCDELRLFTEKQILNLRKQISFKKWRTKEPLDDSLTIERPVMMKKAASMLIDAGAVSPTEMLNEINIHRKIVSSISGLDESIFTESANFEPPISLRE